MKKRIIVLLALLALLTQSVLAEDSGVGYSGVIDPYTGQPTSGIVISDQLNRMQLSGSAWYDRTLRRFVYPLSSGAEISSTAMDGMVTTDAVAINVPATVTATLYRDGKALSNQNMDSIRTPGSYVLSVQDNSGQPLQPLSFTIVNPVTGVLDAYRMPAGFAVTEVYLDGVLQKLNTGMVDLTEEGEYDITYCCVNTDRVYELKITVDHTAPVLALEGVVDGVAKGPVDLSDAEEGASLLIIQNGEKQLQTTRLTETADYSVRIEDEAGNVNLYQFTIGVYLNVSSWVFIIATLLLIGALVMYLLIARRNLRIR